MNKNQKDLKTKTSNSDPPQRHNQKRQDRKPNTIKDNCR